MKKKNAGKKCLGVVMDPIEAITPKKDSTLAMLVEAQRRGWELFYMMPQDIFLENGSVQATLRPVDVSDRPTSWYTLGAPTVKDLSHLDLILMRKDPPFNLEYIYTTYLLELAEAQGAWVVNQPASLRNYNEKLALGWFPQCAPPTLVSASQEKIRAFAAEQGEIVLKPLDGMGGRSIFRITSQDVNFGVILEVMTANDARTVMAQKFVPEITAGDKRILLINGTPLPRALARIPMAGESRGNLAAGAHAECVELSERDRWICDQVSARLLEAGLLFVGLDVIGDYLTEINVTSPTGIREIYRLSGYDGAKTLFDAIEAAKG